jgi:hypothetical protein
MLSITDVRKFYLGVQGENEEQTITVDVKPWLVTYPNAAISIWHKRNGDSVPSPVGSVFDRDAGTISWTPTYTDTYVAGEGEAEIRLYDNEIIKKTRKVITGVSPSVTGAAGETLESGWQGYITYIESQANAAIEAMEGAEEAEEAAEEWASITAHPPVIDGETGNWLLWDNEDEEYKDSGIKAIGKSFEIAETYNSVAAMEADFDNPNIKKDDYVIISSGGTDPDNGKVYQKGAAAWIYIVQMAGQKGDKGDTGSAGADGTNAYVHIKYAEEEPTQDSDMKDTADEWIGIYSGTSSTAPEHYTSYTWFLMKGDKGDTGSAGADGDDGADAYVHIKWSADEPEQDSDMKSSPDEWMGIYSGTSSTAPAHYTSYTWYKVKGETGSVDNVYGNTIEMSSTDSTKVSEAIAAKYTKPAGGIPNSDLNTPPIEMIGASISHDGAAGYVPKPTRHDVEKFLKSDGSWADTPHQDISGKADKVSSPTSGNFAGLDSNGNLVDSGCKESDFLKQHQDISGKADKVSSPTSGDLAGLDSNGNLVDSGSKPSDFASVGIESGVAIVIDGDTAPQAISAGQFLYIKNHSTLANGAYHATTAIASAATITSNEVETDTDGVANSLSEAIAKVPNFRFGKENFSNIAVGSTFSTAITFGTGKAMPDANYSVIATANGTTVGLCGVSDISTTGFTIYVRNVGTAAISGTVMWEAIG